MTTACLASLGDQDGITYETIVVDNASSDESVAVIRSQFPGVKLIENSENVGFAQANNQGIAVCRGPHVLLLNSDTVVYPGALETMLAYMEAHPQVGACGPRLLNTDGTLQESAHPFPTLPREAWRLFHLDSLQPKAQYAMEKWPTDQARPVDALMGACMLIRRHCVGSGGSAGRQLLHVL